jgi:hypothetical protein
MEMDCVAHCGDFNGGSYVTSLVLTDIASGWTEAAPLVVRESGLLVETLERIRQGLPFQLRALDVDNGSEFIKESLILLSVRYRSVAERNRGRPSIHRLAAAHDAGSTSSGRLEAGSTRLPRYELTSRS